MIMKTATHEEMLSRFIGEQGTPERTEFENELKTEILGAYYIPTQLHSMVDGADDNNYLG
jgi:hypothetical protein